MFVFVITDSSCQQFIGVNLLCCMHLLRDKQKKAWLKVQETNESLGINIEIWRCHDANFPVHSNLIGSTFLGDGSPTKPGGTLLTGVVCEV